MLESPNQHAAPSTLEGTEECVPEGILERRKSGPRYEYHVKWMGFSPDQNTWEPAKHLPKHMVREFNKTPSEAQPPLSEYEQQRLDRMAMFEEYKQAIGIDILARNETGPASSHGLEPFSEKPLVRARCSPAEGSPDPEPPRRRGRSSTLSLGEPACLAIGDHVVAEYEGTNSRGNPVKARLLAQVCALLNPRLCHCTLSPDVLSHSTLSLYSLTSASLSLTPSPSHKALTVRFVIPSRSNHGFLSMSLSLSVSFCLSLSLRVYVCLCLCLCLSDSVSLCLSPSLPLSPSLALPLSLALSLSLSVPTLSLYPLTLFSHSTRSLYSVTKLTLSVLSLYSLTLLSR